ncbi:MAG: hypothetical protein SGILL_001178 [Bacillariaceae sp.]
MTLESSLRDASVAVTSAMDGTFSTTGTTSATANIQLHGDLALSGYAGEVWTGLLRSAPKEGRQHQAVIEVGMHNYVQCLQAATEGFQAHCFEPSPSSFQRITNNIGVKTGGSPELKDRVHLYNVAAGSEESSVPFVANGGTGDHVGQVDMWKMETISTSKELTGNSEIIQVPSQRLDSSLATLPEPIFLLKIDTQGFEPQVFAGLTHVLSSPNKPRFVLTEFWPRGMDVIAGKTNRECIGVSQVLQIMVNHGYRLYVLPVESHPKAPIFRNLAKMQKTRPLDDVHKYCQWFYDLEDKHPSEEYKMGYWTDFLAVSADGELPQELKELPVYV